MKEISITVDILARWTDTNPIYRIYVDSDLLTERTYIWDNREQYVRENILVSLNEGLHTFIVESVNSAGELFCKNFKIDKNPTSLVNNQFTIH